MVDNSTNIDKVNNHFSSQTIEHTHMHTKKIMTYGVGNSGPRLGQA